MNNTIPQNELDKYKYCPRCQDNLIPVVIDSEKRKECKGCGFIFWNNPKPVVSIILEKGGKILMLQRAKEPFKNYWVLPGGFINYKETAEEAIKREVKEETGLTIAISGIVGVYRIDNDPRGMHIDIIFYATTGGNPRLSMEDKKWNFFSQEALPQHIAYKHRDAVNDWYAKGNQYGKTHNF